MKGKTLIAIGGLSLAAALLPAVASAHTNLSIGVNLGGYPAYEAPAPVYYSAPAPVYYSAPAPVYYGGTVTYYGHDRPWCRDGWREREGREHEWREHHRRWHDDD